MELFIKYADEFTEEDRKKCIKTIPRILEFADIARRQGLLAFESLTNEDDDFILKIAVALIVDGTDPFIVKNILNNFILSGSYNSYEKLNACIITEGFLSIQSGENPKMIQLKLVSMLGEKICAEQFGEAIMNTNQQERYLEALAKLEDNKPEALNECRQFEELFLSLNDSTIQRILRDTTNDDCVVAFSGCSHKGIKKILNNLSLRLAELILNDIMYCSASKQYILETQVRILNKINEYEKMIKYKNEVLLTHYVNVDICN